jgi:hypothetical protein
MGDAALPPSSRQRWSDAKRHNSRGARRRVRSSEPLSAVRRTRCAIPIGTRSPGCVRATARRVVGSALRDCRRPRRALRTSSSGSVGAGARRRTPAAGCPSPVPNRRAGPVALAGISPCADHDLGGRSGDAAGVADSREVEAEEPRGAAGHCGQRRSPPRCRCARWRSTITRAIIACGGAGACHRRVTPERPVPRECVVAGIRLAVGRGAHGPDRRQRGRVRAPRGDADDAARAHREGARELRRVRRGALRPCAAAARHRGVSPAPPVRGAGPRLRPGAMQRVRTRHAGGALVQAAGCVPVLRQEAHVPDRGDGG